MMNEAKVTNKFSRNMVSIAEHRARKKARTEMWDLNAALFFFYISLLVIVLVIQPVRMEFTAPFAVCGLFMGWLIGRLKRNKVYKCCYAEELSRLQQESEETVGTKWERVKADMMKELGEPCLMVSSGLKNKKEKER